MKPNKWFKVLTALLFAFVGIKTSLGATLTVGSSGADYTTLKSAFAAVGDGDTVQLIEDISYSSSNGWNDKLVVDGKRVTLDLNGHNVTYTRSASPDGSMFYLKNGAELLIDGTGTIVLTPITNTHTTFKCVEMSGNTGLKATLGANVTVYTECFGSIEYTTNMAETGSTFDIYGKIIANNSSYINNLFTCSSGIKNFTVNILGGTLETSKYSDQHINIQSSAETTFTLNMTSGKIYCTQTNFNAVKMNLWAAVEPTFNITGGYFGSKTPTDGNNPTKGFSLPEGYGFYPASGVEYCPYQVGVCEATIGSVCYPTISAAIEAATPSNFVVLNVNYSDTVTIPAGKTVNFNGGSYTFSGSFTIDGTLKIIGGTYTFNPAAELLGPGCSVTDNGDGTWTVIQSVAQVGETAYSTFADALAAANALGTATIKFLADVDLGSSSINIAAGKNITLDLNGNNLTCSASDQFLVKSGATLILCDTSDGASGTLTHSGQYDLSDNSGTVEILSGTYNVVNYGVAYNNGSAVLNIKGGTINSAKRAYYKGITTISGGTIKGTINDVKTTVITGGVFDHDPTDYVDAENYQVLTNTPSAGYWTVGAPQPVAQIGANKYETLQDAIDAAVSGDTIELLMDIELDSYVNLDKQGTYVIDGADHTISMADGATFDGRGIFGFGPPGITAPYSVAADKNYTLKNVTVTGFDAEIVRCEGVSLTFDNCVFINNNITQELGRGKVLLRIASSAITVTNCEFTDNSAFNGIYIDEQTTVAATININGNLFSGNTISGNGIVQVATAASESDAIVGNTFSGNTLESSENVAVLYISAPVENVSGNLFSGNMITTAASKKEGVIVLGGNSTGTVVNNNAFVDNTLGTTASHYATIYTGANCNLAGNYWGEGATPEVKDHADVYASGEFAIDTSTFASAYAVNDDGCGVTVTIYVPPVAQIGETKYPSLAAAIAAVPTDGTATTITMLADSVETAGSTVVATQNVVLDLNGKTVSYGVTPAITVCGSLTVDDSSVEASGCIKNAAASGVAIYCDAGSVTVDNGIVGSLDTYRAIVVDHVGTVVVNDGSVIASNAAIRSTAAAHDVITINGGTIGASTTDYAVYDYDYATIAIHGGVLNADKIAVTAYGSTLTIDGGEINKYGNTEYAILLGEAGTATISAGTINSAYTGIFMGDNGTTLNITGGTITAANQDGAIGLNGTKRQTATINISGGTIVNTGTGAAIYQPAGGTTVNVSGNAVLTGSTGIAIKGGTLNISGGTISATGPYTAPAAVNSGATSTGDAVYVEDTYGPGDYNVNYAPTVNITGGTLSSVNGYAAQYFTEQTSVSTYKANGSINITGDAVMTSPKPTTIVATTVISDKVIASAGYFTSEVPAIYCADGYLCTTKPYTGNLYKVVDKAAVTFAAGDGAPAGATVPERFDYPSGDRAEIKLSLPTYTSEDYTFGGWTYTVDDKTVNIGTTFPAGTTGDKALVGTWTKAAKIEVVTDSTKPTEKVEVKVTEDWVKDNVTKAGEVATSAEIKASLEETKENGLTGLENYVLGLNGKDPNAKLKVDSTQSDSETSMPVVNTVKQTVDTGFTVKYSLDKVDENGAVTQAGEQQETSDLDLNLAAATSDSNSAYFKMTATIAKNDGVTETEVKSVPSENTIGVMKVESQSKTTVIGVPWTSLSDDGSISVADIVRTSTLSEGDQIQVYDTEANGYRSWTLDGKGAWVADEVIGGGASTEQAQTVKIDRGKGVLLTRTGDKSKPIYLVGSADNKDDEVSTTLEKAPDEDTPAWNLVASPSVEAKTIEEVVGENTADSVIVPTDEGPRNYTYKNGEWGYDGFDGEPVEIAPGIFAVKPKRITNDKTIPAGRGFWYLNKDKDTSNKKINW